MIQIIFLIVVILWVLTLITSILILNNGYRLHSYLNCEQKLKTIAVKLDDQERLIRSMND
jgi:hypothetical protein